MVLHLDFVADWCRILRDIMSSEWGYDVSAVSDNDLPARYFNAELRRPDRRPRIVKAAAGFNCPPDLRAGWDMLKAQVVAGGDLTPNLSKRVLIANQSDEMLFDWGVYHFHLGVTMSDNFVSRTGPLLFAFVTADIFYVIGIFSHGDWTNEQVVEVIHSDWPEALQVYRMPPGPSISLVGGGRTATRRAGANLCITTKDGTVYLPPGGGLTLARSSALASRSALRQKRDLKDLEAKVLGKADQIEEILREHGDVKRDKIEATLAITESRYSLEFKEFGVSITILESA